MNVQWVNYVIFLLLGLFAGYGFLYMKVKWSLRKINRTLKNIENLVETNNHILDLFKQNETLNEFESEFDKNIYLFLNSLGYLFQIASDFMVIYGSLILSAEMNVHKSHLDFLTRSLAVQIHEIWSKVNQGVLNTDFQNALIFMIEYYGDKDSKIQLDWIRNRQKQFNRQAEQHRELLKEIRNTVGAHREIDTLVFNKFISDLDFDLIIDLANHTLFFVLDIVKKINEIEIKFQDKIKSDDRITLKTSKAKKTVLL